MSVVQDLDGLDSGLVDLIHTFWFGRRATALRRGKAARIEALAQVLEDTEQVAAAVATWPVELRHAIAFARRAGRRTVASHASVLRAEGLAPADDLIATLVIRGVLLVQSTPNQGKIRADALARSPDAVCRLSPGAAALDLPVPRIPLVLPVVPAAELGVVQSGDASVLVGDVLRIVALAGRRKLRLNASGLPGGPLLAAVEKELGHARRLPLVVAIDGGAVDTELGVLHPGAIVDRRLSLQGMTTALFENFLAEGRWRDDAEADADGRMPLLATSPWGAPAFEELRAARRELAAVLRRLDTDDWVAADSVVDALLAANPSVADRTSGSRGGYGPKGPTTASERGRQRDVVMAILTRTFAAFGVVDVGARGAELVLPRTRPYDHTLDALYRNDANIWRREAELAKPVWKPEPSPLVVRVSAFGRRVLDPFVAPPAPAPKASGLHVGGDFEVVAHRHEVDPGVLFLLDGVAVALPGGAGDPIRRWRLDRDRWTDALERAVDPDAALATLSAASARPLPENVVATLRGWTAQFGRTRLFLGFDLAEFASGAARDAAIEGVPAAVAVGTTRALVPAGRLPGRVVENAGAAPRCLDVGDDGVLAVDLAAADLGYARSLTAIATEEAPGRWRLDRARVAELSGATVLAILSARARNPPGPAITTRVRAWCGEVKPARVDRIEVVQVPEAAAAGLALLPEVAPNLRGVLPGGVLVVAEGRRRALVKVLEALGVKVEEGLALG